MALVRGFRTGWTGACHAAADGGRIVRPHALVRGAGEPQKQPGYRDLLRGRQGARQFLRAEPLLRAVRRSVPGRLARLHHARRAPRAAHRRRADLDRGCPFPQPLGHRHPLAGARGREDRAAARRIAGRRIDHHPAARQEPLSARHGAQPKQSGPHVEARARQVQGVDHGPEAGVQLHEGGDRRHVSEHGGVRIERLRHQVGRPHLLQQEPRGAQRAGGRHAGGCGERPDPLFARPQSEECAGPPQSGDLAHGRVGSPDPGAARLAVRPTHHAQLQARIAQRRAGDLFPRDAAAGNECRAARPPAVLQRVGL